MAVPAVRPLIAVRSAEAADQRTSNQDTVRARAAGRRVRDRGPRDSRISARNGHKASHSMVRTTRGGTGPSATTSTVARPPARPGTAPALPETPRGAVWLYGQHAVAAALANPARRLRRLLLTEEAQQTLTQRLAPPWPLSTEQVDRGRLDHLLGRDIAHQGAALLADPLAPPSLQHALDRPGPLLVLDQVTDPRNVGAILRSAAAFGVAAVITQDRNAPEETGAWPRRHPAPWKPCLLLRAVNIARTLIALKAAGIWVVGLDAGGGSPRPGRRWATAASPWCWAPKAKACAA